MSIGVYWGSTNEFMTELRQRWEEYQGHRIKMGVFHEIGKSRHSD